ncbi:hypothetical protein MKQ70_21645 [Chitinophaga sedimenti]|uniref:hypothetical protein n=1 Tax=Chitinophaga sedimenti TaxID=2033606 RepID=UPI0020047D9C|nr:hypothetical protein [Chitinophaga sedimenti]MCK7557468.1 hypothetical protein [Chitinophaga sedimenti]
MNSDFLLAYNRDLDVNWSLSLSAGGNRMDRRNRGNTVTANNLEIPGLYTITNGVPGSIQYDPFSTGKELTAFMQAGSSHMAVRFCRCIGA